jgi:hypothetical protein
MISEVERTDWLNYPTENFKDRYYRDDPPTGAIQEYLSNHPTVLLFNDKGVERIGKRDVERNISGVYTRAE